MKHFFILFYFLFVFSKLFSQSPNAQNLYDTNENPYYWKNRTPVPGYWQQDVHYLIDAYVDEKTSIISGKEKLIYTNNSSDNLNKVYFHLYTNAQTKDSYLDKVYHAYKLDPKFGEYASKGLGCKVSKVLINGIEQKFIEDNTLLIIDLTTPILPGSKTEFELEFKTYFDQTGIRNRMKSFNSSGNVHFDGVHWYPRIAVYDRKFGWTADQHFDREFYGDYGSFDVNLNFANDYIVDGTGIITNEKEVLPEELLKKLDIKNFKDKPFGSRPSIIIPRDGSRKIWKFHAENVHDFGFTADPAYRIGVEYWNGIKVVALAQENNASKWQNAAEYAAKIIEVYSTNVGMYAWPKVIVADARDGMEYPMMTLNGGTDPGYRGLFCHELGHQWFFGMIGNNETYRASLDEGFTQFLTVMAENAIDGPYEIMDPSPSNYVNKHREIRNNLDADALNGYVYDAVSGNETHPLNTHSDYFGLAIRQGGGYRQVYFKTATMLFNLQLVLGDSLFDAAFKNYFNQWKFCHPYFEDFRNSFIQFTKVDLNWFFDQWLETTKVLDYSIEKIKKKDSANTYLITFKRIGEMTSPIDFQVVDKLNNKYQYHIPNTYFTKSTQGKVLPKWTGWEVLNKTYTAEISLKNKIQSVQIDTSFRMGDVNQINNYAALGFFGGMSRNTPLLDFDSKIAIPLDRRNQRSFARPEVWYNNFDGVKVGLHCNGNYLNKFNTFSNTFWFNTGLLKNQKFDRTQKNKQKEFGLMNFVLNSKNDLGYRSPNTSVYSQTKLIDGLFGIKFGVEKKDKFNNTFFLEFKSMFRFSNSGTSYLYFPQEWSTDTFNNTINMGISHGYKYIGGSGSVDLRVKNSAFSNHNYNLITFISNNSQQLSKFVLKTRAFLQVGTFKSLAKESALFLYGGNPEEMMENKYTRSVIVPYSGFSGFGAGLQNFAFGGGLNLRGYSGYLSPELNSGMDFLYKGVSGFAFNTELEFDKFIKLKPKLTRNWLSINSYFFADAGRMFAENKKYLKQINFIRADAGIGFLFSIKKFGPLQTVEPLNIRFDMPLWLSNAPYTDPQNFTYIFLIGINRAF